MIFYCQLSVSERPIKSGARLRGQVFPNIAFYLPTILLNFLYSDGEMKNKQ